MFVLLFLPSRSNVTTRRRFLFSLSCRCSSWLVRARGPRQSLAMFHNQSLVPCVCTRRGRGCILLVIPWAWDHDATSTTIELFVISMREGFVCFEIDRLWPPDACCARVKTLVIAVLTVRPYVCTVVHIALPELYFTARWRFSSRPLPAAALRACSASSPSS